MLKREISEKLKLWRTQKNKKALCIIGARQIGKTTIIREFAKQEYENFVEINFILDKGAEKIFEDKLDADTIIENLTAFKMQKMEPGKTLVFLDEIQECPMEAIGEIRKLAGKQCFLSGMSAIVKHPFP